MVTVTQPAILRLQRKHKRQPDGTSVRMTAKDGHGKFRPDTQQEGDLVFSHDGRSVLVIAAGTARRVARKTLDVVKTVAGKRLRFVPTA